MRNIYVLPTNKPSRLAYDFDKLILNSRLLSPILYKTQNIYITNDEEIKEGDSIFETDTNTINIVGKHYVKNELDFKIILTTDQDLIKDGVQAIDDEFLEWFVKNPSSEEVEVEPLMAGFIDDEPSYYENMYEIIIPKEEPKKYTQDDYFNDEFSKEEIKQLTDLEIAIKLEEIQRAESEKETLEEVCNKINFINPRERVAYYNGLKNGAKYQQERSYSKEEVFEILLKHTEYFNGFGERKSLTEWFNQFKKK